MLKMFVFINIWFAKQDIQKWLKTKFYSFLWRIKNEQKEDKKNLTYQREASNPRFSVIFPPMIWIFMWSEEPEIKSKQASKSDRTLATTPYFEHTAPLTYSLCITSRKLPFQSCSKERKSFPEKSCKKNIFFSHLT